MATATATTERSDTVREPDHSIQRKVAGNYLRVAIWANQLENGGIGFSIKPTVRYKDNEGNYQNAKNFREADLVNFSKMFFDADTWCQQYRQRHRAETNGDATPEQEF